MHVGARVLVRPRKHTCYMVGVCHMVHMCHAKGVRVCLRKHMHQALGCMLYLTRNTGLHCSWQV